MVLGNTATNRNIYERFIFHDLCSKILNSCFAYGQNVSYSLKK